MIRPISRRAQRLLVASRARAAQIGRGAAAVKSARRDANHRAAAQSLTPSPFEFMTTVGCSSFCAISTIVKCTSYFLDTFCFFPGCGGRRCDGLNSQQYSELLTGLCVDHCASSNCHDEPYSYSLLRSNVIDHARSVCHVKLRREHEECWCSNHQSASDDIF